MQQVNSQKGSGPAPMHEGEKRLEPVEDLAPRRRHRAEATVFMSEHGSHACALAAAGRAPGRGRAGALDDELTANCALDSKIWKYF